MRLTRSEIRANALRFAAEWRDASDEQADAQSFWAELFAVFGVHRRSVASFERKVRNVRGNLSRMDVFYSGVMLGEHKSRGEDLSAAASQAFGYVQDLTREIQKKDSTRGRTEIPRYVVVSDFARIVVYDLDADDPDAPAADFLTADLADHIDTLGFMGGYTTRRADAEDEINIEAVELLGNLHDALEKGGYSGHDLERFLVRVLFCLFADDTEIFDPDVFKDMVGESRMDGSDLGPMLEQWFRVLDRPKDDRNPNLPSELLGLPYVNGDLFGERLDFAVFNGEMRAALFAACEFDWSRISPAVFGSLFQSIMAGEEGKKQRRQIGAHYTSERDILKLIRSLFLDDLHAMLAKATTKPALERFQGHLASLKFLDPACGCGNFLVVAYRELRLLELEALKRLHAKKPGEIQMQLDITALLKVQVDQMHGIEIAEWPARIAEVAMWLIDHQMNRQVGAEFGVPVLRLPLTRSAKICIGNALRTDWGEVLSPLSCDFVMGNPPFVGKKEQNRSQKGDLKLVWQGVKNNGVLDYVTCWYAKATAYIMNSTIRCAFVSTNSICQGEQVPVFWHHMLRERRIRINFAHRTFAWQSEARGKAHVHVVIIGFSQHGGAEYLFDYQDVNGPPAKRAASRINAYLEDSADVICYKRMAPMCTAPPMVFGTKMVDDGHFDLTRDDRDVIRRECPAASAYIRPFIGAKEVLNSIERYTLWLVDAPPSLVRKCKAIRSRVEAVRIFRLASKKAQTVGLAQIPSQPGENRQPDSDYLLIPKVSSIRRAYLPVGYFSKDYIANGSSLVIPGAKNFHFGIMSSAMHSSWLRTVGGRMKSDYQYSNTIVYNNFPWPEPTDAQRAAVEATARAILDARARYPDQTLADLYDPVAMPKPLRDAHAANDRAVDRCYRPQPFTTERARVEFLFDLYQKLVAPLTAKKKKKRGTPKA